MKINSGLRWSGTAGNKMEREERPSVTRQPNCYPDPGLDWNFRCLHSIF